MSRPAIIRPSSIPSEARRIGRDRPARLAASFWAAVVLGAALIVWSTLMLPFLNMSSVKSAPGNDAGDMQAPLR
jgi:hypothetical protein